MKETFWMVFAEGGNTPTYKHSSQQSAEIEAKRIAKLSGKKVFVLCTVKSYMVYQFTEEDCTPETEQEILF